LKNYYPWSGEVEVEAGKVTRLEKIILFPLRPNIKQLNIEKIASFCIDEERERIYYIDQEENVIYRSDLEGESFKEVGSLPQINPLPKKWKVSPDKEKLLGFNLHQVAIIYLNLQNDSSVGLPFVLEYSSHRIVDVFWHSDSYHLILITDKNIEVLEANPQAIPVELVTLNGKNASCFYDDSKDVLYFLDSQKAADGRLYDNVYKLELSTKIYPFRELIKTRPKK
jgi:hypothetical protein